MSEPFSFRLTATDGAARTGEITTAHGLVHTPAFMPVGTQAAIKGVHHDDVRASGAEILLGNTYHLMLRPSAERIAALGGPARPSCGWPHPILTDSGGFQVMSLAPLRKITDEGVTFRSHLDGAMVELTPERAMEVQILLGSDIAMQLDECVKLPAERCRDRARHEAVAALGRAHANARSSARRPVARCSASCKAATTCICAKPAPARWSTSVFPVTRLAVLRSARPQSVMLDVVAATGAALPADRPRYLMGVGTPADLLEAIARGVDMFDCVTADPQRPPRPCFHPLRPDQHQECAPCRRSAAAR